MSMIMGDYVAGFLGLGDGNAWNLPAFDVRIYCFCIVCKMPMMSPSPSHSKMEPKSEGDKETIAVPNSMFSIE